MINAGLQPWLQRLIAEHQSVCDRRQALTEFVAVNPTYQSLPQHEQSLMRMQLAAMATYQQILEERLRLAGRL